MKLSEALRLGSMAIPPATNGLVFEYDADGKPCGACAIGTALYAAGHAANGAFAEMVIFERGPIVELFPLALVTVRHPGYSITVNEQVGCIVSSLFECHKWTRERIADWVESIEQQQESAKLVETPQPVSVEA